MTLHDLAAPALTLISQAEATSYHWTTLDAAPDMYGPAVRAHLLIGATVLAKDYLAAQRVRRQITDEVNRVLQRLCACLSDAADNSPTTGCLQNHGNTGGGVLQDEIGHTGLANVTGHPAISVPCGFADNDLPVGLQFTGRAFSEDTICRLAAAYEADTPWHTMHPPV